MTKEPQPDKEKVRNLKHEKMGKRNLWIVAAIIFTTLTLAFSQTALALSATATANPSTIQQGQTSQLNVSVTGASGTSYYLWSSVDPGFFSSIQNPVVAPNVTTTYTVQVFNANTVTYSSVTVIVTAATGLTATASAIPPTIVSGQTSQLDCNPTGGSGSYTYSWTSSPAGFTSTVKNPVVSPTVNTTYTCTVGSGTATTTASATVTVIPLLNGTLSATPQTINTGQSSQLNATPTGGNGTYTYSWTSDPAGFTSTLKNPVVTPSDSTWYLCDITSGNQTIHKEIIVNVNPPVAVTVTATPGEIIAGQTSQLNAVTSGGTGTYTYSWSSNPAGFTSILKNPVVSPQVNTTYTCNVTSGPQNATGSVNVTVTAVLTATATATPASITSGQSSQLNCTPAGGNGTYTYAWTSNPAGFTSTLKNPVVTPTATTTYTCAVSSGQQNITTQATVTVSAPGNLTATATATPTDINPGQSSTLNCNATGGTGTYTYSWTSNPAGFTSTLKSPVVTPSVTTIYTCTVTSGTSTAPATATVRVLTPQTLTATTTATPSSIQTGQTSQLNCTASGGSGTYSYSWSSVPAGFTSTQQNPVVSPNVSTTYTCTVTSGTQTAASSVTVSVTAPPSTLTVTASANPTKISSGQSSQLNCTPAGGTGNYTYSWTSSPAGFTSTLKNPVVKPTKTTTYTVTVNDGTSVASSSVRVRVSNSNFSGQITLNRSIFCAGENVTANAVAEGGSGNYTYSWSSLPEGISSTSKDLDFEPQHSMRLICMINDGDTTISTSSDIIVNEAPLSKAGNDTIVDKDAENIKLHGKAENNSTVAWSTDGDGLFSEPNTLKASYTPGPADLIKGSVTLTLTANAAAPCFGSVSSAMIITFKTAASVPDPETDNYSVSVYPNPTPGQVHIRFTGNEESEGMATVTDVSGKILEKSSLSISKGAEIIFDLAKYPSGIYFITVDAGNYRKTHKVIHQ